MLLADCLGYILPDVFLQNAGHVGAFGSGEGFKLTVERCVYIDVHPYFLRLRFFLLLDGSHPLSGVSVTAYEYLPPVLASPGVAAEADQ